MISLHKIILASAAVLFVAAATQPASSCGPEVVIPAPAEYALSSGVFSFAGGKTFSIIGDDSLTPQERRSLAGVLTSFPFGLSEAVSERKADVVITIDGELFMRKTALDSLPFDSRRFQEAYRLEVTPRKINVYASSSAGAFYALQTLAQITGMRPDAEVGCCTVDDAPRFGYRGLHVDVSRHFRSKEFLMKQMDAMALLKLNRMHLHLTDGAGWRIEIDGYPRLTDFAAWRPQRKWSDWWASDRLYCGRDVPGAYGGYYTREDLKQILDYASKRHIEVIPEIEMPGHSEEVLAAYPELACCAETDSCGGTHSLPGDLCPGKEATFAFIEDVLDCVMDIFPSEYVHIGGDEASKSAWEACPDCRKRMREEGLSDVDELQSYFIRRVEAYVNSRGRRIIGWDEILQGGLAPDATVMSWRGTEGGVEAMRAGHDVIMTPNTFCYLDYTQDAPFKEPVSIGGYVTLAKTYSYEPAENGLSGDELTHLLGVQGNLWAEYIPEDSHAEYMYYPRAFAIAETGWSLPERKDYEDFRSRALVFSDILTRLGYTVFDLRNEYGERKESLSPVVHLAVGADVDYALPVNESYPGVGDATLTDGLLGGWSYGDGRWQGFLSDVDVTVDLGSVQPVRYVGATFMQIVSAWVYFPEMVDVSVSDDGVNFRPLGTVFRDFPIGLDGLFFRQYGLTCDETARYVRLTAARNALVGSWLFTDEIVVN